MLPSDPVPPAADLPPGAAADAAPPPSASGAALVAELQRRFHARGVHTQLIETHLSWVLLAGAHAYKLKKPVHWPFVDYSTLQARQHGCEEELRLNRRLAPWLYEAVLPLRQGRIGPTFRGQGAVLEWVLQMHRMPAGALASQRLAQGLLTRADLQRLATRLAAFHERAGVVPAHSSLGSAARVLADAQQVLRSLQALQPEHAQACAVLWRWFEQRCSGRPGERFAARQAAGRVRDGHGDLHLDNVIVLEHDCTTFDCIEFDPALRCIDVMADIGFLVMDLQAHGRRDLAYAFLNAYLENCGDYAGLSVLRDYLVYRALVRALVASLREQQHVTAAALPALAYLQLAQRLSEEEAPRLLITHGLPGSGKTHLSQQVLERAGAVRLRSDVERKRCAATPSSEAGPAADAAGEGEPPGLYGQAATERTYARLFKLARGSLQAGFATVIDAAFLQRWQRDAARALARRMKLPFTVLSCRAPMSLLRQRLRQRAAEGLDASDADLAVLARVVMLQQPLADDEVASAIQVETAKPVPVATLVSQWLLAQP